MMLNFNCKGNKKQLESWKAWNDPLITEIVYGGSKGSGKSYLGIALIFSDAFTYPGTNYFIARKELNDLRKFTLLTIHEVFNDWGVTPEYYKFNGQDNYWELHNGSRVYFLSGAYLPSDPLYQRFGSIPMTRGWIEEAGEFEDAAKNNLAASIGRWKNKEYGLLPKLLMTCNPSKNFLYDYYLGFKKGTLESYRKFIQAFPEDNKTLAKEYIENLHRVLSRNEKERLLYGNWEYDDDPTVMCEYEAIMDCFTNDHVKPNSSKKYISADLAMMGRDSFVTIYWQGNVAKIIGDKGKSPGKEIETDLVKAMETYSVPRSKLIADSDGLGAFLSSYIKGIKEFHGGAKPFNPIYDNLKSECAFKLAEKINKRELKIECESHQRERIIKELGVLKQKAVDGDILKKGIIKKDVMKSILGHSPDYLDALIMGMYYELMPKQQSFVIPGFS